MGPQLTISRTTIFTINQLIVLSISKKENKISFMKKCIQLTADLFSVDRLIN